MSKVSEKNHAVIMAGGVGSRFWPLSKKANPKQFHDILGTGKSLIRQTFERLSKICLTENIWVVTNTEYRSKVVEHIPEIIYGNVLCEPVMRNTAPCIAYANFKISKRDKEAVIIVAPSDHLILDEEGFIDIIELAIQETSKSKNLVTLGIKPSRPDTGYGYICFDDSEKERDSRIKKVDSFTEKPDAKNAKKFLKAGNYYWNSGIFIWSLSNIQKAFQTFLPEIYERFEGGDNFYNTKGEKDFIEKVFPENENISIDYGIMEKANNVKVILSDFGWSDLGTWGSLNVHLNKDSKGNAAIGKQIKFFGAKDNIVRSEGEKLLMIQGLENFIVIDTPDSLLICKQENEQEIKNMVNYLKENGLDEYV